MPGYNNPMGNSPLEVKVISKRFGLPNSTSLDVYRATRRLSRL